MANERPDLDGVAPEIVAYIESLEEQLAVRASRSRATEPEEVDDQPSEPPTTVNVITISAAGRAKRTPRHRYSRQRRGGMGVFDLETPEDDAPEFLLMADEQSLLTLVTDQGRAFHLPVNQLVETDVNSRGQLIVERFPFRPAEKLGLIFADSLDEHRARTLVLVTERGQVRRIGSQYLGKNLQPGSVLYNVADGGAPAAACWTSGSDELFIVTRRGQAIRFAERQVPVRGCLGIRVEPGDAVVGIAALTEQDGVFLLSEEGKGTIRLMSGFSANKSPGSGGKTAIKADTVVGAAAVVPGDDLFAISRLGKIIRFAADEVPGKEGTVQGVNCMNLRADSCVAVAAAYYNGWTH